MARRQQGFFLVEVIIALFVFSLVCAMLFPMWQVLQEKRIEQQHKSLALDIAQNEMERFRAGFIDDEETEREIILQEHQFQVRWHLDKQVNWEEGKVEIEWTTLGEAGNKNRLVFVVCRNSKD
ncbi:type II secretory pathway pseudopilin PulG [Caldalkalibacillus uzonensis]|uniref:Type II secretory pathway pseudopilin PulG n=1 Tax=Caldalkalibacillus uzonensis TaxID=353224 RepID=A0ABU0CNM5_9BACI|nr:type II secretion system protein [Caldalkalibacillus uzonensis]MDQ0337683.1 type II secretory pathway pseudopilin PulG [Caldalkalibacillus uzonensis]